MRNALIGAFVLSAMLAPYAAHAFDDRIEVNDGDCIVLDQNGGELTVDPANTTVKVKTNGTTLGTCRTDLNVVLIDTLEFDSVADAPTKCFIAGTEATEWEESINKQGKLILQCKADGPEDGGLPPGNPNFCTDHPDHEKC